MPFGSDNPLHRTEGLKENGYVESLNGKRREEVMSREFFRTLLEAKTLIGDWRGEYDEVRPRGSLQYRPPTPKAMQPALTLATLS